MNKADLLADIGSKALSVVATVEEPDSVKNAAGVKVYLTNVMQQNGDSVESRNIGWYTIDEGTAAEKAFYRDKIVHKNVARNAVKTYMDTLSPAPYIRYDILQVNEDNQSAIVSVMKDNGNNTATEMRVLVHKNGANPITHIELTN